MTTTLLPFASLCPNIHHGRLAVSGFSSRHVVRLVPRSTFSTRAKKTALYPEGAYGQIADEKFMCSSLLPSVPWVRMVTSNGGSETHLLSGVHRLNSTFRSNTRMRLTEMRQGLPFLQQRNQVFQERLSSSSLTTLNNTRHQPEDERGTAKSCVKENILSELSLLDRRKSMDIIVFDRKSTLILIGAQGLLILASVAVAMILNIPNFGLGSNFVFDTTSVFVGVIATLPLFGLAFVLDIVESYVPALREVTMATQRSVLALLGERRKPLVAILTSIALGEHRM